MLLSIGVHFFNELVDFNLQVLFYVYWVANVLIFLSRQAHGAVLLVLVNYIYCLRLLILELHQLILQLFYCMLRVIYADLHFGPSASLFSTFNTVRSVILHSCSVFPNFLSKSSSDCWRFA